MRKCILFFLLFILPILTIAQKNYQDIVFLKNGTKIKGKIIDQIPKKSIRIVIPNGDTLTFFNDQILLLQTNGDQYDIRNFKYQPGDPNGTSDIAFVSRDQHFSFGIKPSFIILVAKSFNTPNVFRVELSSQNSYAIGITVRYQLSNLFAIQIEPRFIVKGYNIDWRNQYSDKDVYINNYISLPTLLCISPVHNFNIELGPDFGYLVSSKVSYSRSPFQNNDSPFLKHFEFSLITGISYTFFKHLNLGIRYGIALTPYEKIDYNFPPYSTSPEITKIYNRYFEFFLNAIILKIFRNN